MTYPLVRFVDAPDPAAVIRFDFNAAGTWADDETWPEHDGFSLGAPAFEGDPDAYGVEYGYRELGFNLLVDGSATLAARTMGRLSRELQRRDNWLLFQLSAESDPVWFKTYRSQPGELSLEHVYVEDASNLYGISVSLAADPFAYGERVTLPAVSISNDPIAAGNPMRYELPPIVGDAPAPLRVAVTPSAAAALSSGTMLLAVNSLEPGQGFGHTLATASGAGGNLLQLGTDTTLQASTGAVDGTAARVAFTDATMATRVSFLTSMWVGRYRVFVRLKVSDSSTVLAIKHGETAATQLPTSSAWRWVELGNAHIPYGNAVSVDSSLSGFADGGVTVDVQRVSGSGTVDIDAVVLLPARQTGDVGNTSTAVASGNPTGVDATQMIVNGEHEITLTASATGTLVNMTRANAVSGGYPLARPGADNHLFVMQAFTTTDDIARTASLAISYLPRFLYLAGE
jgi:hypothetical protein